MGDVSKHKIACSVRAADLQVYQPWFTDVRAVKPQIRKPVQAVEADAIRRVMHRTGCAPDRCEGALLDHGGDERAAVAALQSELRPLDSGPTLFDGPGGAGA